MLTGQTHLPVIRLWPASWNPFESELWTRLRESRENWQSERDLRAIERALGQLSARQLKLLGMSRASLASDVSVLIDRAEAGRRIADEIICIVDDTPRRVALPPPTG